MLKRFITSIALAATTTAAFAQNNFFPAEESYKLKNGLEVIFADYGELPVTSLAFFINVGKKNETPGQQGLADLTANALLLGNEKYTQTDFDNQLFKMGAAINASSNVNFTTVSAQFLNKDMAQGMEMMAQTLLHPLFPKTEIDQQIGYSLSTNKPSKMDITQMAGIYSDLAVYGSAHPLGRHFYETQMRKITPEVMKEFWKFNYTPKNTKLVVTGKPDRENVKKLIEQYFGSWEAAFGEVNGSEYELPVIKTKSYTFVNKPGVTQACLAWSKRAPAAGSKDVLPFEVANRVFGKLLMDVIREKEGKTYGIYSSYNEAMNSQVYRVQTSVRNEVAYATVESFDRVLTDFYTKGVSESQLKKMKTMIRTELVGIEDPGSLAAEINPWVYRDYNKRKMYLDELDKLDLATVNKAVKKYFTADAYKLVIAGDDAVIGSQFTKLSGLQKMDVKAIEVDQ